MYSPPSASYFARHGANQNALTSALSRAGIRQSTPAALQNPLSPASGLSSVSQMTGLPVSRAPAAEPTDLGHPILNALQTSANQGDQLASALEGGAATPSNIAGLLQRYGTGLGNLGAMVDPTGSVVSSASGTPSTGVPAPLPPGSGTLSGTPPLPIAQSTGAPPGELAQAGPTSGYGVPGPPTGPSASGVQTVPSTSGVAPGVLSQPGPTSGYGIPGPPSPGGAAGVGIGVPTSPSGTSALSGNNGAASAPGGGPIRALPIAPRSAGATGDVYL
jgi:hypothetical protein